MNKRFILVSVFVAASVFGLAACAQGANSQEAAQVSSQQDIYNKNLPVPTFQYSQERAALIQLYNQRVKGTLNTWTVWMSYSGVPLGMCASKGFPLPYSTELTNPSQVVNGGSNYSGVAVGQMDPNGVYPSQNALATWVMCLSPDGAVHPQYIETLVTAFTYPVEIQNGKVVQTGAATVESTITQKNK
jgi:hypothetical protein